VLVRSVSRSCWVVLLAHSRYGKLDPFHVVYFVLYRCDLWFAWVCVLLWAYELLGNLCWMWVFVVQVRIVADTNSLTQARCAGARPGFPARVVAQATRVCFKRAHNSPRRGGVSPKRDPALFSCSYLSPRLGGGGLAWARLSRLSKIPQPERGAGRDSAVIGYLFVPEWSVLVEYDCMMSDMYIMEHEVCLAWFMNFVWRVGYDIGMGNEWVVWN